MATTYLEQYGAGDERRSRVIKRIIAAGLAVVIFAIAAFLFFHNRHATVLVNRFLAEVNDHQYDAAYKTWGCGLGHSCRDYSYQKFLEDWGPGKAQSEWKIGDIDGCSTGVILNVQAKGAELQSLWVERGGNTINYSPFPECQEKKWRFSQFFHRIFGKG